MKKMILLVLAIVTVTVASSQNFKVKKSAGIKFDVESGTPDGSITVQGETFEVFKTEKGARYVKAVSSKGSLYPVWIGTETEYEYDGKKVYRSKSGSYCVFKLTKSGYPHATWLEME